jgi:hypothetical protein
MLVIRKKAVKKVFSQYLDGDMIAFNKLCCVVAIYKDRYKASRKNTMHLLLY